VACQGHVGIYGRQGFCYISPDDRTVDGVWIGSGHVVKVEASDPDEIGGAVLSALGRSRGGAPHPRQEEWAEQRRRALAPILEAAGLRTWRSFVRTAQLITACGADGGVIVELWAHDGRRLDVFVPAVERHPERLPLDPDAVGLSVAKLLSGRS
jgi:hypothetical protein